MRSLTALGAFIFAGGFTLGVKRAGFRVRAQFEDGPFGVKTTRRNHPDLPVFTDPATWPVDDQAGVDLVYGNPPCAIFSIAGYSPQYGKGAMQSDKWRTDPRTSCIWKMVPLLERLLPTVWTFESVQLAASRGHDMMWELAQVALARGYAVSFVFLNVAHLGLPQRRRRFFFIAHRVELIFPYDRLASPVTVGDALHGLIDTDRELPKMSKFYDDSLRWTKAGEELRTGFHRMKEGQELELNARGQVRGRPAFVYRRLAFDDVAPTLLGGPRYFHPTEHRHVSVREFAVLNGYPPNYVVLGQREDQYRQLAQAVTPTAGEWLARAVRAGIERGEKAEPDVRLVDLERDTFKTLTTGAKIR